MVRQQIRTALVRSIGAAVCATGETGKRLLAEATAIDGEPLIQSLERVQTRRGGMCFYCLGELSLLRARTLSTKEPDTIDWIETFKDGEVLWDIGANVGMYSIYAATGGRNPVVAFEPGSANYFLLNRNIEINHLQDSVTAYCVALSDTTGASQLHMKSTGLGGAFSSYGKPVGEGGREFNPKFRQGMLGFTIDDFIALYSPPFPNHIKIDVDGLEISVLKGATNCLADSRLKSVLVEHDLSAVRDIYTPHHLLEEAGFQLVSKSARHPTISNYIFRRSA